MPGVLEPKPLGLPKPLGRPRARTVGLAGLPRLLLPAALTQGDVFDRHDPLIVAIAAFEDFDRLLGALAGDGGDRSLLTVRPPGLSTPNEDVRPPGDRPPGDDEPGAGPGAEPPGPDGLVLPAGSCRWTAAEASRARGTECAAVAGRAAERARAARAAGAYAAGLKFLGSDDAPLSVFGHRVFVFLAEVFLADQEIEVGRIRAAADFAPEFLDRVRDLAGAEDQLGLFFTFRRRAPRGHRHAGDDAHDRDADQQRGHRIAGFRGRIVSRPSSALTL